MYTYGKYNACKNVPYLMVVYTVHREIFASGFFCHFSPQSQRVNFKLGEFLSLVYLPLNTTFSGGGGIKDEAKSCASE